MTSYDEHLAWLVKQEMGARAERQGFLDAQTFDKLMVFSQNRYEQSRYADGYQNGKAILRFGKKEVE